MLRLQSAEPESPNQHDTIAIYGCAKGTFDNFSESHHSQNPFGFTESSGCLQTTWSQDPQNGVIQT